MEKQPQHRLAAIGIVGGGFGSLLTYITLRWRGVGSNEIIVFSEDTSPETNWFKRVKNIGQKTMRSESAGHFFPTDSPGLATREALHTWSLKPLVLSWFDRYHPTVNFMISHALRVAKQTGFFKSLVCSRISKVVRDTNDSFALYDEHGLLQGRVRHLVLAVGHGPVFMPPPISSFKTQNPGSKLVNHAFDNKNYVAGQNILVVGGGLTAGTEWIRILEQGGKVIALSNQDFSFGQALNTPRMYFSRRGIDPWRNKLQFQRLRDLKRATRGTIPDYPHWKKTFTAARKNGDLIFIDGNLKNIEPMTAETVKCRIAPLDGSAVYNLQVNQVVAATGFLPALNQPLLKSLVRDYQLDVIDNFIEVDNMFCIPKLSSIASCAFLIGPAAAWGIPCADSLGGMKIVARTIARHLLGDERWYPQVIAIKTIHWLNLIAGRELV